MSIRLVEIPSTGRRRAGPCLACGLVIGFGWIALLVGAYLFVVGSLPGSDPRLFSSAWLALGMTLVSVGSLRAYDVLVRPR